MGALLHQRRSPTIQTPNETGEGYGERKEKRCFEPIPSQQHLETGRVEVTTLPQKKWNEKKRDNMEKKVKVKVYVEWADKNFCATFGENVPGVVAITAKDIGELKKEVAETLRFHTEGMLADGDDVPQWLVDGNYEFEYDYVDAAALIHACEPYASLAALSRATGINQRQLSHYANGLRHPRPEQRRRIVEGVHSIGRELLSVV